MVDVNPSHKRYLHFLGGALGIAGVVFVAGRLYKYADQVNFNSFSAIDGLLFVLLGCLYGAANLLLAVAWQQVLAFLQIQVNTLWAIRTYGVSQLAKYVPGNIFQFAGRQAIGMAAGISGAPLFKSTAYELIILSMAGVLFGILIIPLLWDAASELTMLLCFVTMIIAVGWGLSRYLSHHLATAWRLHSSFLAISGMVFWGTLWMVSPQHHLPVCATTIFGAYVLAWLFGLVTPGAPAGVGVREAVLLFLLEKLILPGDLLLAIAVGRVVTVFGDFIFFITSSFIKSPSALMNQAEWLLNRKN